MNYLLLAVGVFLMLLVLLIVSIVHSHKKRPHAAAFYARKISSFNVELKRKYQVSWKTLAVTTLLVGVVFVVVSIFF